LPGIGRSTAGAILSFAWGQPQTILDGNVKRVLARHFAVEGWSGRSAVLKSLWALAESLTPREDTSAYNQAMMDLGAMICQRGPPRCDDCPLQQSCQAHATGRERELPTPKPRKALPVKSSYLLVLRNPQGAVLLERRPPAGIWGGLWSFPECPWEEDPLAWCESRLTYAAVAIQRLETRRHTFTHFHYDLTPVEIRVNNPSNRVMDVGERVWYNLERPDARGLAAPVLRILQELQANPVGESE
jgi:A/G-specific adenine glycosylase